LHSKERQGGKEEKDNLNYIVPCFEKPVNQGNINNLVKASWRKKDEKFSS
jgi:hypothetical protein